MSERTPGRGRPPLARPLPEPLRRAVTKASLLAKKSLTLWKGACRQHSCFVHTTACAHPHVACLACDSWAAVPRVPGRNERPTLHVVCNNGDYFLPFQACGGAPLAGQCA